MINFTPPFIFLPSRFDMLILEKVDLGDENTIQEGNCKEDYVTVTFRTCNCLPSQISWDERIVLTLAKVSILHLCLLSAALDLSATAMFLFYQFLPCLDTAHILLLFLYQVVLRHRKRAFFITSVMQTWLYWKRCAVSVPKTCHNSTFFGDFSEADVCAHVWQVAMLTCKIPRSLKKSQNQTLVTRYLSSRPNFYGRDSENFQYSKVH